MTLTQRELGITRNGSRTFQLIHCLTRRDQFRFLIRRQWRLQFWPAPSTYEARHPPTYCIQAQHYYISSPHQQHEVLRGEFRSTMNPCLHSGGYNCPLHVTSSYRRGDCGSDDSQSRVTIYPDRLQPARGPGRMVS